MRCRVERFIALTVLVLTFTLLSTASSIEGTNVIHKQGRRTQNPSPAAAVNSRLTDHPSTRTFADHAAEASVYVPSDAACGFATPCYSTIRAPEPQSLFLVGSGLIAMAGFLRRRF